MPWENHACTHRVGNDLCFLMGFQSHQLRQPLEQSPSITFFQKYPFLPSRNDSYQSLLFIWDFADTSTQLTFILSG